VILTSILGKAVQMVLGS